MQPCGGSSVFPDSDAPLRLDPLLLHMPLLPLRTPLGLEHTAAIL